MALEKKACREYHVTTRKSSCFLLSQLSSCFQTEGAESSSAVGGEVGEHMSLRNRETLRFVFIWLAHTQEHTTRITAHWCLYQLKAAVQTRSSYLLLSGALKFSGFPVFQRPSFRSHCLTRIHHVSKLYLLSCMSRSECLLCVDMGLCLCTLKGGRACCSGRYRQQTLHLRVMFGLNEFCQYVFTGLNFCLLLQAVYLNAFNRLLLIISYTQDVSKRISFIVIVWKTIQSN